MEPPKKELTGGGDKRPHINLPFRALNEGFLDGDMPDSSTALDRFQGTPEEGTSVVQGPALHFLQQLFIELPELGKEVTLLHQNMLKEQEMLEEGHETEKEAKRQ